MIETRSQMLFVSSERGEVSTLLEVPPAAPALLVLGHGAGSHLAHPLLEALSRALHARSIATFRFNYPYSERRRGMDSERVRLATVRAAALAAAERGLPLFAGGHSMSGRMVSLAHAQAPLPDVLGLLFLAFPLHAGPPDTQRAQHLGGVELPMLFISGTRDKMAEAPQLESVVQGLERARLHWIDTADHSFRVLKRRATEEPPVEEIARVAATWIGEIMGRSGAPSPGR